jgi:hypothetical protein
MSNGSSVLDESASTLFAYAAPEIERSKVLFEGLRVYRSFNGNDIQDDQMFLFEKLSAGLFDDVIMMGLCIHTMVLWKCDEEQLKTESQNVAVCLEQERLFQEQLKVDVMEQHRFQQVNMGLNAQLQKAKLELKTRDQEDALRQVEEARDELAVHLRGAKLAIIALKVKLV